MIKRSNLDSEPELCEFNLNIEPDPFFSKKPSNINDSSAASTNHAASHIFLQ